MHVPVCMSYCLMHTKSAEGTPMRALVSTKHLHVAGHYYSCAQRAPLEKLRRCVYVSIAGRAIQKSRVGSDYSVTGY
jgi:hypothetical protein